MSDEDWMAYALSLARRAADQGEVPVGAAIVSDGQLLADGWNRPIAEHDPTAHAEISALRAAAQRVANYRLPDTTLYVTLEPCVMCMGAIVHARVGRLVFGAFDPTRGACGSVLNLADTDFLNHRLAFSGGILAEPCGELLRQFFRARR